MSLTLKPLGRSGRHFKFRNLSALLRSCVKGKAVRAYYEEHKELNESFRNKLADVLNEYLKEDHDRRFPSEVERELTEMILNEFPTECEEIWMGSACSNRETAAGRGTLVKRYYHIRRELNKSGLIEKRQSKKGSKAPLGPDESLPESTKESISWLNYNTQPWPKVLQLWKETREARLRTHIGGTDSIETYFNTYPALKDNSGFLLFESDFEGMFPNANSFYTQWPILAAFVEKNVPSSVLEEINDSLTPEGKKVRTITSIPYLFSVTTVSKTKTKSFRPSRSEVAESLLMCVPNIGDINPAIEARLKKYEPFKLKFGAQAILVGDDEDSIQRSYVRLNKHMFEMENPLKAMDITFKVVHATDAEYPTESKREWMFLERAVYGIKLNVKGLDPPTANMVKKYNKFKDSL